MKDESDKSERSAKTAGTKTSGAKTAREARLKSALRDNLKRRKSQARGRAGMTIVTPEDDARAQDDGASPETAPDARDRG